MTNIKTPPSHLKGVLIQGKEKEMIFPFSKNQRQL
jgi:hypothetical protein